MQRNQKTTVFLCGDVMTGRGIDQLFAHPSAPVLREPYVKDARDYLTLAEEVSGPIPRPVEPSYIWGDALPELARTAPDTRIVNLETSITRSDSFWEGKGIHYRMHPANIGCLTAAGLDVCVLANNHVLDFGYAGLSETLRSLREAGIQTAGAGENLAEARRPAVVDLTGGGRILVFAFGAGSSGIPPEWAAQEQKPGVSFLSALSEENAEKITREIKEVKQPGDLVIASIHWGSNWGYGVPREQRRFAHRLIEGGVDLIHGHSSHHPRPLEVYRGRLILYGCGDFLNDYEGIGGYESFRGDLALMYFASLEKESGALVDLRMIPMQIHKCRLRRASFEDILWQRDTLDRFSRTFGARVALEGEEGLRLLW